MTYTERARQLRPYIVESSQSLPDQDAYYAPELFPAWAEGVQYVTGDRRQYQGKLYKCLQNHTSQADWTPDVAVSLWAEVPDPAQEWPEWKAPTGAHDAYEKGAKVSHLDRHWVSNIDANVYEPGAFGWDEVS